MAHSSSSEMASTWTKTKPGTSPEVALPSLPPALSGVGSALSASCVNLQSSLTTQQEARLLCLRATPGHGLSSHPPQQPMPNCLEQRRVIKPDHWLPRFLPLGKVIQEMFCFKAGSIKEEKNIKNKNPNTNKQGSSTSSFWKIQGKI